jgi:hypothetical protein
MMGTHKELKNRIEIENEKGMRKNEREKDRAEQK